MLLGTARRLKKFRDSWKFKGLTELFGLATYKMGSRSIAKIGEAVFKVILHGIFYFQ